MDARVDLFIKETLNLEGNFSNNSNDKGGATKWGITEATARQNGYTGKMEDMPIALAYQIYANEFYYVPKFDKIQSNEIAYELFDTGVNCGTSKAVILMQRAYNALNYKGKYGADLLEDGSIGTKSIEAINKFPDPKRLFAMMNMMQASNYIAIAEKDETQREFVWGWLNQRVLNQIA